MRWLGRGWFFGFCAAAIVYLIISGLCVHLGGSRTSTEDIENAAWINTSKHWLDRQLCRWFSLCGTMHLNRYAWTWHNVKGVMGFLQASLPENVDFWDSGDDDPATWSGEETRSRYIPQYILDHAPYVHLFSGEKFWPSDVAEHLMHTSPHLNYHEIQDLPDNLNFTELNEFNIRTDGQHGRFVYLHSKDNVENDPQWLTSTHNIPNIPRAQKNVQATLWPTGPNKPNEVDKPALSAEAEQTSGFLQDTIPSPDGTCGGNTGFTCKGSRFGNCCSMHGWCGKGEQHCGQACNPIHGDCIDPNYPPLGPKLDLRRRMHGRDLSTEHSHELGKSRAPAILVVVDKGNGTVDAFWFFFYSYNLGLKVFRIRFGNHVGDWEHTMIRFQDGKPVGVFLSEHNFGAAYEWQALERYLPNPDGSSIMLGTWSNATAHKAAKRPVVYSATGSHAMYPNAGLHPFVLPFGLLHDQTDRGPLWDPARNFKAFHYNTTTKSFKTASTNPRAPVSWLDFNGHWGDKYYRLSDDRQYRFAGQYHYVNGPTGPKFKRLGRKQICLLHGQCNLMSQAGDNPPVPLPSEYYEQMAEEGGLPGGNFTDEPP
ncbi:carbohydrate-binding module family 18 protein [Piedraia hortae CBS 480.64]|uniref:Carbohydrate-binding module family 18 protein n=1 Tax=Piedraia hortae CBS 480.64 TaxID=1314780 RepID=A0A6A7C7L8_9PEZI|nr:carbohydrate-binding module family 18 protein [Piedraia hortae CBS 480.64]